MPEVVCKKGHLKKKNRKNHRRATMPGSLFKNVTSYKSTTFLKRNSSKGILL